MCVCVFRLLLASNPFDRHLSEVLVTVVAEETKNSLSTGSIELVGRHKQPRDQLILQLQSFTKLEIPMSHQENHNVFHFMGWLRVIFTMAHYKPCVHGVV